MCVTCNQPEGPKEIYSAVNAVFDRERRKFNVVVLNMPESSLTEGNQESCLT